MSTLDRQSQLAYATNCIATYFRENDDDDCRPEFLVLQAQIWKLTGKRPSDSTLTSILALHFHQRALDGKTLYDNETMDDVEPGEPNYPSVLAAHQESYDQQITSLARQLLK